jgi:PAS domain S-box-containing protein
MRLANEEGQVLRVNEAYCRLVEKPREALEGQLMSEPYEAERSEEILSRHRQRFASRRVPRHIEQEVRLWNGKTVFFEVRNSFLEIPGQSPLLVSTFRDISDRKWAEQREAAFASLARSLSAASSAAAAARIIADTAYNLIGWDACSLDLYSNEQDRVTPVITIDTIEGKRVDVPPSRPGQAPSPLMRRVLNEGGQLILRTEPIQFSPAIAPFGNVARPSASLMFVPIRLGQKTIGMLSIQSYRLQAYRQADLNTVQTLADQCSGALERIRAEEEVRRINAELEQHVAQRTAELRAANKEMEAFTYSVAHDLRAPLRHISAFTRILHEDFASSLPADAIPFLDGIQNSSQNMSRLVDDLLNLARVGRQHLKRESTPLGEVAAKVVDELKPEAPERKIEWHIQSLPVAECDPGLIKVVFSNLLSNAVKYTRPRPVAQIEVGCVLRNGRPAIFVHDNGVGFDMKHAGKLFGVFQRLHQAEEFEGTGVGLATVERIIRKHGGSVWAEAEINKGATFYFTLAGLN